MPDSLVDQFLDTYVDRTGSGEWVNYQHVPADDAEATLRAAREAARRMGIAIFADAVPSTDTSAPVRATRGQIVIRIADFPPPWA